MWGAERRAMVPQAPGTTGTSRQPSTRWPSAVTLCSIRAIARSRGAGVLGQEAHAHAVPAGIRQVHAALPAQERVGELDEDPRAVAGVRVGALGAAVLQLLEREQGAGDHLVRPRRTQTGDEGNSACIVLVGRVVQPGSCQSAFTS